MLVTFGISLVSAVVIAVVHDQTVAILLAAGIGYILSLNSLQLFLDISKFCCTRKCLARDICQTEYYWIVCFLNVIKLQKIKQLCFKYLLTLIKLILLLTVNIVTVYFTISSSTIELSVLTSFQGVTIGLLVILEILQLPNAMYCAGFRAPYHPRNKDFVSFIQSKRKLLQYFSIPRHITLYYSKQFQRHYYCTCIFLFSNSSLFGILRFINY